MTEDQKTLAVAGVIAAIVLAIVGAIVFPQGFNSGKVSYDIPPAVPAPQVVRDTTPMDFSWVRQGGRKYNEDGSLIPGGPVRVIKRRLPIRYTQSGGATVNRNADIETEIWDRASQMAEDNMDD